MGIYHSAYLVYGVHLTVDEVNIFRELPDWDNIYDSWGHTADFYTTDTDAVMMLGIVTDSADEGEITEIDTTLSVDDKNELKKILNTLGIERVPTWHLTCQVS